jgi:hypothetical protein
MPLKPEDASDVIRTPGEIATLFPWVAADRLRGIPHLITPAWATDKSRFDPEHYADSWKEIGFDSVTLLTVHHDGQYLYPSRLVRTQPARDFFGEQVTSCRERDIRTIAYYSLTLNSLVGSEHPEWRVRDVKDRPLVPDHRYFFHYHWLCVNSPFREFAIAQMLEICEKYPVDALWLDIAYLPPHPLGDLLEGRDTCFCEHCHRAYDLWYQGEHLIDALGTPRHDEFRAESYRRFLIDLKRGLTRLPRPIAVTFNGAGRIRLPFYERVDELADWDCAEAHHTQARGIYSRYFSGGQKPFELMSCSEQVWSHNVSKPTPLLKLEAAATILGGGTYTLGINHAPDGRLLEGNMSRLSSWGHWCRQLVKEVGDGKPASEIALLIRPGALVGSEAVCWFDLLGQSHFLFSCAQTVDSMQKARLWILASGDLNHEEFELVKIYLHAGGTVLVNGPVSPDSLLARLAGVSVRPAPNSDCYYLHADHRDLQVDLLPDDPIFFKTSKASLFEAKNAEVLASLVPPFEPKSRLTDIQIAPNFPARPDQKTWHPGLIKQAVGRGTLVLSALGLDVAVEGKDRNPWTRILLRNLLVHLMGGQAIHLAGHAAVEAVVTTDETSATIWLLNHLYDAGSYIEGEEESVRLHDVSLTFTPRLLGLNLATPDKQEHLHCRVEKNQVFHFRLESLGLIHSIRMPRLTKAPAIERQTANDSTKTH